MADKNLVEIFVGNHQRCNVAHGARPKVEDHFLAIAEFEQKTGTCLGNALVRHAGAAGNDPHFVFSEYFGPWVIRIALWSLHVWPGDFATGGLNFADRIQALAGLPTQPACDIGQDGDDCHAHKACDEFRSSIHLRFLQFNYGMKWFFF